jgi:hypothetical protein
MGVLTRGWKVGQWRISMVSLPRDDRLLETQLANASSSAKKQESPSAT